MQAQGKLIKQLIKKHGQLYSEQLGIRLETGKDAELFKWFLAALLFGARIDETCARKTYLVFKKRSMLTPRKILNARRPVLIRIMGLGSYARYDEKTSTELPIVCKKLLYEYGGKLSNVHKRAKNAAHLEMLLQEFYSVGPVTCNIFLRELRTVWSKANPMPSELVQLAAKNLKINLRKFNRKTERFMRLECALLRIGKHCRSHNCKSCEFREYCKRFKFQSLQAKP